MALLGCGNGARPKCTSCQEWRKGSSLCGGSLASCHCRAPARCQLQGPPLPSLCVATKPFAEHGSRDLHYRLGGGACSHPISQVRKPKFGGVR